jgi:hypothetical protein
MHKVSCPSCGAPVEFKSHATVMVVCEYCHASIIKDGDAVKDIGKLSAVLEDYSPIQIGTAGVYRGRSFTVIGRIQLRYGQGMWNEWYLLYDDGTPAWLGDASGQYTITILDNSSRALPAFEDLSPGGQHRIDDDLYIVADRRESECIGGQGELPFRVGDGWRVRAADLRRGADFVTLDYTDGSPVLYRGKAVLLDQLQCQLLRSDDEIKASAGRYRGKLDALDCPSCGTPIKYLPGVTSTLVCPGCATALDAAGPEATVLAAGNRVGVHIPTIELGATGNIGNNQFTVIGAMTRMDEENSSWTEYLAYGTRGGFFWLVETDEGWFRAQVLDEWPQWHSLAADSVKLANETFTKLYDYQATVTYVAGAFNWRVAAGDRARIYEFERGQTSLSAELTGEELSWSKSTPLAYDQIQAWFGKGVTGPDRTVASAKGSSGMRGTQMKFLWWILGLNAIPLLVNFGTTMILLIMALLALFIPSGFFQSEGDDK